MLQPVFVLHSSDKEYGPLRSCMDKFSASLASLKISKLKASVTENYKCSLIAPSNMNPILNQKQLKECNATIVGLEVRPIHIDSETSQVYPLVLRTLHKGVSNSIQKQFLNLLRKKRLTNLQVIIR